MDKLIVDGLEMFVGHMGANERAKFFVQEHHEGWEVVMDFRGHRRFAMCDHKNDAEVIAEALNERKR
jgi:hypothetical protein